MLQVLAGLPAPRGIAEGTASWAQRAGGGLGGGSVSLASSRLATTVNGMSVRRRMRWGRSQASLYRSKTEFPGLTWGSVRCRSLLRRQADRHGPVVRIPAVATSAAVDRAGPAGERAKEVEILVLGH